MEIGQCYKSGLFSRGWLIHLEQHSADREHLQCGGKSPYPIQGDTKWVRTNCTVSQGGQASVGC